MPGRLAAFKSRLIAREAFLTGKRKPHARLDATQN
jgi:hypothetical protein